MKTVAPATIRVARARHISSALIILAAVSALPGAAVAQTAITEQEAHAIAVDAYLY